MKPTTARHSVLLVEDDPFYIEQHTQILNAIGCDVTSCDNKEDALRSFRESRFCLVLLDMSIRGTSDGIKDRASFGFAVLDELRRLSPHHNGVCWWLPIVATSAVVSAADDIVRLMRLGAATFVAKTVSELEFSEILIEELRRSGRETHDRCFARPLPRGLPEGAFPLRITGTLVDRRTVVLFGDCQLTLTETELYTLLKLAAYDGRDFGVHKSKFGRPEKSVSQEIERLRKALEPAAGERQVVENDGHGYYRLSPDAQIVACDADAIAALFRAELADLARAIAGRIPPRRHARKRK
jgi:DNA-binding response OmpR family regulator